MVVCLTGLQNLNAYTWLSSTGGATGELTFLAPESRVMSELCRFSLDVQDEHCLLLLVL